MISMEQRVCREVWETNFEDEIKNCLAALAHVKDGFVAFDTEFPGVVCDERKAKAQTSQYRAVRDNVNILNPIQIGLAVADASGMPVGVWNFNLRFDLSRDLHADDAVEFLTAAGVDFPRHARDGIYSSRVGWSLATSPALGLDTSVKWITFSGSHDWGYLLKILSGKQLPNDRENYKRALEQMCPKRFELRDCLPYGSLESLLEREKIIRCGRAHSAASDALATLDLYKCTLHKTIGGRESAACLLHTNKKGGHALHRDIGLVCQRTSHADRIQDSSCARNARISNNVRSTPQRMSNITTGMTWGAVAREAMLEAEMTAMLSETTSSWSGENSFSRHVQ